MKGYARGIIVIGVILLMATLSTAGCERRKPARQAFRPTSSGSPGATASLTVTPQEAPTGAVESVSTPRVEQGSSETPTPPPSPTAISTLRPTAVTATSTAQPTPTAPPPTQAPSPTLAVIQHTVKAGETLFRIAQTYHTTADAILAANPGLQSPNRLVVGSVLTVPVGDGVPSTPTERTHIVQRGETLYAIARKYGVSAQALLQANGLSNPNRIVVGQVLVIP